MRREVLPRFLSRPGERRRPLTRRGRVRGRPVSPSESPISVERFQLSSCTLRERWLEFLGLEHSILPLPLDVRRDGDELEVHRLSPAGRRVGDGRIPRRHGPRLFLQVASAFSFFQASGFWLDEEDFQDAVWESTSGAARLWLARTPCAVRRGGPGPACSAVLAATLDRLFARGGSIPDAAARGLFERLLASDAAGRRAEFWVQAAYRAFPELALPEAADSRRRTAGFAGSFLRDAGGRARLEKARAIVAGRAARIFEPDGPGLSPGSALALDQVPGSAIEAARALRIRHSREAKGRRAVWIAVDADGWDRVSRRGFESAARTLGTEVEVVRVPAAVAPPRLPDEWRRELFVPCGTFPASLRFYERLAELASEEPSRSRELVEEILASPGWSAYVSDPTGQAPLPHSLPLALASARGETLADAQAPPSRRLEDDVLDALGARDDPVTESDLRRFLPRRGLGSLLARLEARGEIRRNGVAWRPASGARKRASLTSARKAEICRRWAALEPDAARRVALLLDAGRAQEALSAAERWFREGPADPPERWFSLSSRLAGLLPEPPAWLEMLEAERELAGGRSEEAAARFSRIADSAAASDPERRGAALRAAEVGIGLGRWADSLLRAVAWRRAHPDAPAAESVRALRVEACARGRQGELDSALELVARAAREGARLPVSQRVETGLVRAGLLSLAGRFEQERNAYEALRAEASGEGDELLVARVLAREALGLADRRLFGEAVARLEQALSAARDDPVERSRLLIDLAAALYHGGRPERCGALLDEAGIVAAEAGRHDLARVARGNRVELAIDRCEWSEAGREIARMLSEARRDGDEPRVLVALHQRCRLALRRGELEASARDNAEARSLAARVGNRLEIGELWLEEGDRLLYSGDLAGALAAYQRAAEDPPDRCDSEARARQRLRELSWREVGGAPSEDLERLQETLAREDYAAAETAARWQVLLPDSGALSSELVSKAESVLRSRGGIALADRVFGRRESAPQVAADAIRAVRGAVASSLAGEPAEAPLSSLGLDRIELVDAAGRELASLGRAPLAEQPTSRRALETGTLECELRFWPPAGEAVESALAMMIETLLFRPPPVPMDSDFSQGWRRLGIVTADSSMEEPYRRLLRFAAAPVTVIVRGESGSGKEAVARAVHALSPRAAGPFVPVNVPAIPAALLESELFGHARGAFTGAERDRVGLLESAAGGTIFFDEIGDLAGPLQAKLLRALQDREIRRVGENRTRRIDARVVSATSRDLAREVEAGRFREDLYYRLHVAVVALPPLRDRGRDVTHLARHFLVEYAREYSRGALRWAPEALSAIAAYSWPGNVRELQNAVAQAAALAEKDATVTLAHLPEALAGERRGSRSTQNYRSRLDAHRRGLIAAALERAGGNRSRAARDLGLSRQALAYLMRELSISSAPPARAALDS